MTSSIRTHIQVTLALGALLGACKKAPPASQAAANGNAGASAAGAPSGAIALRAMELALDPSAGPGFCIPASMAADGAITVETSPAARFNGTQLVTNNGDVVFRIDGSRVIVPWNEQKGGRIDADGAWVLSDRNDRFDVSATGVPSMRGEAARCKVRGYDASQRATAIALYVAPMLIMAREMAARNGLIGAGNADAGASPSGSTATAPGIAQIRVINALPGASGAHVTFRWNGIDTPAWDDIPYATRTGHYASQTGSRMYSISPRGSTSDAQRIVVGSTPELEANKQYTAILASTMMGSTATPHVVVEEDPAPAAPAEGNSLLSIFNAWAGTTAVDVCVAPPGSRGPEPVFERVAEDAWSNPTGPNTEGRFRSIPTALMARVQLRTAADRPCTGAAIGTVAIPEIATDRQYSMVLMGERGARAGQLLVCPRDLGECRAVPVRR
ncbi:MAG: DUF4397 domain-containing protein [Myxococcales bacterium]|nr:DUF4397 domain-containing protein [Myxococcales bacterium]